MIDSKPQINILIPLYNEESVFFDLVKRLKSVIDSTNIRTTVILVDDGSKDETPNLIRQLVFTDNRFTGVLLSRNFGHQKCLTAGMAHVNATEGVFILDGDLQDPPELLEEFYAKLSKGYDVVYAIRKERKEGWLKKTAYKSFYRILKKVSMLDMPLDSGDFSMISRRIVDFLNSMPEESRFIRGMRSWVGFEQIGVAYKRDERHSGDSKYSLKKLLGLAFDGIFNFSEYPIKFISFLGVSTIGVSGIYFLVTVLKKWMYGTVPEGFTALLFVVILFGGVQLLAIGIIGEYVLRIFFQVKRRPLFVVKEVIKNDVPKT